MAAVSAPTCPAPALLIDDSRTAQAAFGFDVEDAGFEVLIAGGASEALNVLAQRRGAVVLADYQFPGTNRLDLLAALRAAYPEAPLLLSLGLHGCGARWASAGRRVVGAVGRGTPGIPER